MTNRLLRLRLMYFIFLLPPNRGQIAGESGNKQILVPTCVRFWRFAISLKNLAQPWRSTEILAKFAPGRQDLAKLAFSVHLPKLPEKLPIMVLLHPDIFIKPGSSMLRRHAKFITESNEFRWRATFGAPPQICCDIWHRISPETTMPNGVQYDHLLWGLLQMKLYPSEPSACAIAAGRGEAPDEKTYRKWSKLFISAISLQSTSVVSDITA